MDDAQTQWETTQQENTVAGQGQSAVAVSQHSDTTTVTAQRDTAKTTHLNKRGEVNRKWDTNLQLPFRVMRAGGHSAHDIHSEGVTMVF